MLLLSALLIIAFASYLPVTLAQSVTQERCPLQLDHSTYCQQNRRAVSVKEEALLVLV